MEGLPSPSMVPLHKVRVFHTISEHLVKGIQAFIGNLSQLWRVGSEIPKAAAVTGCD